MARQSSIVLILSYSCLVASAFAKLTYTNATLPTEPDSKTVDVEATGSKLNIQQLKFSSTTDSTHPFISCTIAGGSSDTTFQWSWANGTAVSSDDGAVESRVPKTGTLDTMKVMGKITFTNADEDGVLNIGEYKCTSEGEVGTPFVLSAPVVSMGEREYRSDVEGEIMVHHCSVIAYPAPVITWSKNNESTLVPGERIKLSADNRTLTIASLQKGDAGVYICTAQNHLGIGQAYIKMRIKDRLAALWPFLGILAEVAILVIIILMYERKRAALRRSQEAEDRQAVGVGDDDGNEGAAKGRGGGGGGGRNANDSDLRHRPVRA